MLDMGWIIGEFGPTHWSDGQRMGETIVSSIDASMPPDAVIRAALRETTERLAGEIATPTERAPMWTDFEWRVAIAVSVMHGISGLLHSRLRWQGPAVWQGFLAEQKRQCELRQQRIATLLARLDEAGRAGQVPMLAMKGSALLALDLFGVGERPMSDIDLLVRPSDCDRMTRILHAMGYATEFEHPRHVCLRPANWSTAVTFGEHVDNPVRIELHTRIYEHLPRHEIDITKQAFPKEARDGINGYPSNGALMRHLLLHTAGNLRGNGLRFIQLHDIASVAVRLDARDWEELIVQDADAGRLWWALRPCAWRRSTFQARFRSRSSSSSNVRAVAACAGLRGTTR